MKEIARRLGNMLDSIEQELRVLDKWDETQPQSEMLCSSEPFSVDRLEPSQWLQWIFLPKMRMLISENRSIPKPFSITEYFEESYKDESDKKNLLILLKEMDKMIND